MHLHFEYARSPFGKRGRKTIGGHRPSQLPTHTDECVGIFYSISAVCTKNCKKITKCDKMSPIALTHPYDRVTIDGNQNCPSGVSGRAGRRAVTNKDAKKLKRVELLELLIEQTEENERLAAQNAQLEQKLAQRVIDLEQTGSIAEAAVKLSGVFTQAQDAADRYLESIAARQQQAEQLLAQAKEQSQLLLQQTSEECAQRLKRAQAECEEMERQTRVECDRLLAQARQQTQPEPVPVAEEPAAPQGMLSRLRNRR